MDKTYWIVWRFRSGHTITAKLHSKQDGLDSVKEWVLFTRGLSDSRIVNNDMLIGGDGWAYDMREVVAVSVNQGSEPAKKESGPCWACLLLFAVPTVLSLAALSIALFK